ncbi:hypothetical protein NDU88_002746 [Pleurodeles waltl]|uniref:Uncharacterized protein n=1 Tax=Pleurodeles waltl TaxID=8319 RepID=A0AAV7UZG9_PLEWA|nr:hypothetical protein NDU88_002746 [Pleurodeles waltl]
MSPATHHLGLAPSPEVVRGASAPAATHGPRGPCCSASHQPPVLGPRDRGTRDPPSSAALDAGMAPVQPQGPTSGPAVPGSPGPSRRRDPSAADSACRSSVGPPAPLGRGTASRSRSPSTQGPDRSAQLHTGG